MTTNKESNTEERRCREDVQGCDEQASSEHELIVAAQAGTPGAMDELLVRHRGALLRAARRFTSNQEDVEDLVQDAMLRAHMNIRRFRKESRFGTWLIAIVNNAALSMKRKAKTAIWLSIDERKDELQGSFMWDLPDLRRNPEEEIIRQELLYFLKAAISSQSQKHQIVLQACVLNEQPIREAACALGLTIGSTKSCLYRARRGLSELFVKRRFVKRRALENSGSR